MNIPFNPCYNPYMHAAIETLLLNKNTRMADSLLRSWLWRCVAANAARRTSVGA